MFPVEIPRRNPDGFSRCEELEQITEYGESRSPGEKTDAAMKSLVDRAIWNDDVLRAIEYDEIDVHVKNGVVHLNGHIVNSASQKRIQTAFKAIGGIRGLQNNLVLDDRLTLEVAASLGELEHTHDCKFFTGASHGLISLNGVVRDENVKLLAEKCASSHPNVRGVISNIRVAGAWQALEDQPFLQPAIGEIIYFLDGVSGVVKQVIINPNNRRVIAMSIQEKSTDQQPECLVVVPMDEVRFLTRDSGFLSINSTDKDRSFEFEPSRFVTPGNGWRAPHPYCPGDVLFPGEQQVLEQLPQTSFVVALQEQALWEQLLANDSLGG